MGFSKFVSRAVRMLAIAASLFFLYSAAAEHPAFAQVPSFMDTKGIGEAQNALDDQIQQLITKIGDIYQYTRFCTPSERMKAYAEITDDANQLRDLKAKLADLRRSGKALMGSEAGRSYYLDSDDKTPRPDQDSFWQSTEHHLADADEALAQARAYLIAHPVEDCTPPSTVPVNPGPPVQPVDPPQPMPALPPAPPLDLTPLALPPYFCSDAEKANFRQNVMWPYIQALRAQSLAWANYDLALSQLAAKYSDNARIYWYIRKVEDGAEDKKAQARDFADKEENELPGLVGHIPVKNCTPPLPPVPGGWYGPTPGLPPPSIALPQVPPCFPSNADKEAMERQIVLQLNDLEASQISTGDKAYHAQVQANIEAMRDVLKRVQETDLCKKKSGGLLDGVSIGIGIGIGLGGHHDRDDRYDRRRDDNDHPRTRDRSDDSRTVDKPRTRDTDKPVRGTDSDKPVRDVTPKDNDSDSTIPR